MFDLEQAIATWRRQMRNAGVPKAETLEELECHLRETIDAMTRDGKPPEDAFAIAVELVGVPKTLAEEYAKTNPFNPMNVKPIHIILVGISLVATGTAVLLPGLAKFKMLAIAPTVPLSADNFASIAMAQIGGTAIATVGLCAIAWTVFRKFGKVAG